MPLQAKKNGLCLLCGILLKLAYDLLCGFFPVLFLATGLFFMPRPEAVFAEGSVESQEVQKRPFTVRDSVEMTKITDPDVRYIDFSSLRFKFSPDRKWFLIVTQKGNLETGKNDSSLWLYNAEEVLQYVNGEQSTSLPQPVLLTTMSSSDSEHDYAAKSISRAFQNAIRNVRWLSDNRTVVFLGERKEQPRQVYSIDIYSKNLRQLTSHPRSVESFEISDVSRTLLYSSTKKVYYKGRGKRHFVVGAQSPTQILYSEKEADWPYLQIFHAQKTTSKPVWEMQAQGPAPELTISADGKWAILISPLKNIPDQWREQYEPLRAGVNTNARLKKLDSYTMDESFLPSPYKRFVLLDFTKGTGAPIFDAPSGFGFAGPVVDALWMPDNETVILGNTFLPLDISNPVKLKRRRTASSIIEYNVRTKNITRISSLVTTAPVQGSREAFMGMEMTESGLLKVKKRTPQGTVFEEFYEKRKGQWHKVSEGENSARKKADRLRLSINQDLNTAPEILARDVLTNKEKVITDLNPGFKKTTFGHVEKFEFADRDNREWLAGLVYPPDYKAGKRYPLVIQTHGFNPKQFLIDGPGAFNTTAFAAQALANKGIVVLQLPDKREGFGTPKELLIHQTGIEAAIDTLDKKGIVDRERIGLIGFSWTGVYVNHFVTFSDYDIAAATIADSASLTMMAYVAFYGTDFLNSLRRIFEAVPYGESLQTWIDRNPIMHTDRVRTPLRLEQNGQFLSPWWDMYALLRMQHKPAEFVVFPFGSHNHANPLDQFASQQGNVDWFAFWLKRHERTEPYPGTPETKESLTEQYERWREFHKLQKDISATTKRKTNLNREKMRQNP